MGSPTVEIAQPNGTAAHSNKISCTEQNEVVCARDDTGHRAVVFMDDGREATLLRRSIALKHWARTQGECINITGIDANKVGTGASEMVTIPLRLRSSMEVTMLACYIVPDEIMPGGVDVLVRNQP